MTRYTIQIHYLTGNSFGSYDAIDCLGITWENLERAKAGLARIAEYYRAENKGMFDRTGPETIKTLPGYCEDYPEVSMTFELDDGTEQRHNTFWRGYFERLTRAEVIVVDGEDEGMVFEP
jgi:hypothetical protein